MNYLTNIESAADASKRKYEQRNRHLGGKAKNSNIRAHLKLMRYRCISRGDFKTARAFQQVAREI